MKRLTTAVATALVALACAGLASAHVEVEPATVPPGDLARLTLQVPNESKDKATISVSVRIPDDVSFIRLAPKAGWRYAVTKEKLAQPAKLGDDTVTERIATVTWSGGRIEPGEFDTFDIQLATPDTPGATLTLPTVQTYEGGRVSRWIGAAGADEPAPAVTVAAEEAHAPAASASGSSADGTANAALGLGIAGLVAGLGALVVAVRRRPTQG